DLEQPPGRDAVDAALIFMRLLVGDADEVSKLLLGEAEHDPTFTDARADMTIDVLRAARRPLHIRRTHGFNSPQKGRGRSAGQRPTSHQSKVRSSEGACCRNGRKASISAQCSSKNQY